MTQKQQIIDAIYQELEERSSWRKERFPNNSDYNILGIVTSALKRLEGKVEIKLGEDFGDGRSKPVDYKKETVH
jgi:hypothetical protein